MYSAAFIFRPGAYDEEFHRLNSLIDRAARETDGFLGTESWQSADGTVHNATYYWTDIAAIDAFSRNPHHREAKRQYQRWYNGYHIVVSEVIRSYGDDRLPHLTPNERQG
jgi:heme-degrading monooxygenase HmoA